MNKEQKSQELKKEELIKLKEKVENLDEESKEFLKKELFGGEQRQDKTFKMDYTTFQIVQQVIKLISEFLKEVKVSKGSEESNTIPFSDALSNSKVNFSLHCQKKADIVGERMKTIQIYWKDKEKYKDFTFRNIK